MSRADEVAEQLKQLEPTKDKEEIRRRVVSYMAAQFLDWEERSGVGKPFKLHTKNQVTREELIIEISFDDALKIHCAGKRRGLQGIVTDVTTKKRYRIYGASCGLPHCMCAATSREIT